MMYVMTNHQLNITLTVALSSQVVRCRQALVTPNMFSTILWCWCTDADAEFNALFTLSGFLLWINTQLWPRKLPPRERNVDLLSGNDAYLILVPDVTSDVSVTYSKWGEFFHIERERDPCVILYTVCYFTHCVQFYTQWVNMQTVCNFPQNG